MLHGNLSAVLQHEENWLPCLWHVCCALQRLGSHDADLKTRKRLQERLKFAAVKLNRSLIGEDIKACFEWIVNQRVENGDKPIEGLEERVGDVNLPLPKFGRSETVSLFRSKASAT